MALKEKNGWLLFLFILVGLVLGGLIGELTAGVSWLKWLSYGQKFGLSEPIQFDLGVLEITFGIVFNMNISSILGLVLAIFIYKKI